MGNPDLPIEDGSEFRVSDSASQEHEAPLSKAELKTKIEEVKTQRSHDWAVASGYGGKEDDPNDFKGRAEAIQNYEKARDRLADLNQKIYQESTFFEKAGIKAKKALRVLLAVSVLAAAGAGIHEAYHSYEEQSEAQEQAEQNEFKEVHHGKGTVKEVLHYDAKMPSMNVMPMLHMGALFSSGSPESDWVTFSMNNVEHNIPLSEAQAASFKTGEEITVDYHMKHVQDWSAATEKEEKEGRLVIEISQINHIENQK